MRRENENQNPQNPQLPAHIESEIDAFADYLHEHLAWGSLHIVLDDRNLNDSDVTHCLEDARRRGDEEGARLALLLLPLTPVQRLRVGRMARQREAEHWTA